MVKTEKFVNWDTWKAINKKGAEYKILLERKGDRIMFEADNQGVRIENTTILKEHVGKVYIALTGDQCALTDIRIKQQ